MSNSELIQRYKFFKEVTESNTEFCKENGYFEKFGQADYARIKAENEMLKMKIQIFERGVTQLI